MPFIQVDITEGLSEAQFATLREQIVEVVHEAIGSARAHINVAIRELPAGRIVEAGGVRQDERAERVVA
jgi:phenylpyruvate tautomerase PptA (4-oxalocrotonate tautomerase family)